MTPVLRHSALLCAAFATLCAAPAAAQRNLLPPGPCRPNGRTLVISAREIETHPGDTLRLRVYAAASPSDLAPLPASCAVRWSVSPAPGVSVHPRTGVLRVGAGVPDGTRLTVTARLGAGQVGSAMRVVVPNAHPLVGLWQQETETPCRGGSPGMPARPLQELEFNADGTFSVTWMPFESYRDYWGTYRHDARTGQLAMRVTGGNHVPAELDLDGRAVVRGRTQLLLADISLGKSDDAPAMACASTFRRTR
ncbi:MAG TPA: hypothetical protein VFH27_03400 [Longimicrobiaceae bacterium]|nr:hypothetical protein [Longimicrobiaceae bacterium]